MDLALVLKAVGSLSVIGILSTALLATAAQKFTVEVDERVQKVLDILPGANCGACGNPSCFAAAEAMAEGRLPANACVAGGKSVAEAVAELLGGSCDFVPLVSVRHCGGGIHARRAYDYTGMPSCSAVSKLAGGSLVCGSGCLGFGDCAVACPFDAIALDDRGLPVIDLARCTGCGICVRQCPRAGSGLLEVVSDSVSVVVRCSSCESAKARRAACSVSCIGCKKCEKVCPTGAMTVVDGLARLDPALCSACFACVEACPQHCIDVTGRNAPVTARGIDGAGASFEGFAVSAPEEQVSSVS